MFILVTGIQLISESEEPDHDDQLVGGAVLARLQAGLGARGVWRGQESPRTR